MKKITTFIMAGVLTASTIAGSTSLAFANNLPSTTNENAGANVLADKGNYTMIDPVTSDYTYSPFDFGEYVKSLKCLTESEKNQLLETEKKTAPHTQKISQLEEEITKIYDSIIGTGDNLFDEYDKLIEKNSTLWDKLYENAKDTDINDENIFDLIKKSTALTQKEKDILIANQTELDKIDAEIDKLYDKAADAVADLEKQIDELVAIVDEIESVDQAIWDKVYEEICLYDDIIPVNYK